MPTCGSYRVQPHVDVFPPQFFTIQRRDLRHCVLLFLLSPPQCFLL